MSDPNLTPQPSASGADGAAAPDKPPGAGVLEDLEALRGQVEQLETERDQFLQLLQRTRADFENYQKRVQRDLELERPYRCKDLAADLLGALDNLERATQAAQQAGDSSALVQGVGMVHAQLLDVLKRHGITTIDALHQPFDPTRHQAMMQQPTSEHPPNTVVQVLQQGFMIHDRVLRPASVVVAAPP
jgi:molecular chaperone GrpE